MAASGNALAERQTSSSTVDTLPGSVCTAPPEPEPMETDDVKVFCSASETVAKKTAATKGKTESSVSDGAAALTGASANPEREETAAINISAPGSNEELPPHIRAVSSQQKTRLLSTYQIGTETHFSSFAENLSSSTTKTLQSALQGIFPFHSHEARVLKSSRVRLSIQEETTPSLYWTPCTPPLIFTAVVKRAFWSAANILCFCHS